MKHTGHPGEVLAFNTSPMHPFLELPIVVTNADGKEAKVNAQVQPKEIEYYYPGIFEGVVVVMKSRSSFFCNMSLQDFNQALIAYNDACRKNPEAYGNLSINTKPKLHATS